jgi:hypothetical protein
MYAHDGVRDGRAVYSFSLGFPGVRVVVILWKRVNGGVAAHELPGWSQGYLNYS